MRKRLVQVGLVSVLFLILGTFVSLGFTWWSVKFHESRWTQGWIRLLSFPYFDQQANPSTTGRYLGEANADGDSWVINGRRNKRHALFQFQYEASDYRTGMERALVPGIVPEWSRVGAVPTREEAKWNMFRIEQIGGWPFTAWRGDWSIDTRSPTGQTFNSLPDIQSGGSFAWRDFVIYPYEPVFPGVIYNASIFGVFLYLGWRGLVLIYTRVRAAMRVEDLRCPDCGYNCYQLEMCPECGHRLAKNHPAMRLNSDQKKPAEDPLKTSDDGSR